jgi:hypothetical protein
VTPIGQQNPPGPLKLLGLRKKAGKIPIFDFAKNTSIFSVCKCSLVSKIGRTVLGKFLYRVPSARYRMAQI